MYARYLALLLLAAASSTIAAPFAYVPSDGGLVSVIDLAADSVVATIPVPGISHSGVAVNPAGTRVYVTNTQPGGLPGSVSVIDTATNTVAATIPVDVWPYGVAVDPSGTRVLVVNHFPGNVSVVDAASNTVIATIPVDGQPYGVAVNPAGTLAYVANSLSFSASILDLASNTIAGSIPIGATTRDVAIHPALPRAYVTDFGAGIDIIDTTTNQKIGVIPSTAGVRALAVNRSGTRIYGVGNGIGMLVIDALANTVIATVPVGASPQGVAVDEYGTRVLVIDFGAVPNGNGSVAVVDAESNSVITTIPVSGSVGAQGPFIGPPSMPGAGLVNTNPYGALTVTGAALNGNTISNLQPGAVIQLGSIAGSAGSHVEIDFKGFDLAAGSTLTIRSGAQMQEVVLLDTGAAPSTIGGTLQAQGGNGAPPPALTLTNSAGVRVKPGGVISGPAGLDVSGLGASWYVGQTVVNEGIVDGGPALAISGLAIKGGGQFKGDTAFLSTITHANNPVNGAHFLSNGLQLYPSTGSEVALTLHAYGGAPQFLNVKINGNATVRMPSAWEPGVDAPPNNAVVPSGGSRAAGVPEPPYGGGSMIVQATGSLKLTSGTTNDLAFPGGIVLRAAGPLDINGVTVNQGWTTAGKAFQGIYFESPSIVSAGPVSIFGNDLNWTNLSTLPAGHFRISTLKLMPDSASRYSPADLEAPHQNTYSVLVEAAAAGECWVCLVNYSPVNVQ